MTPVRVIGGTRGDRLAACAGTFATLLLTATWQELRGQAPILTLSPQPQAVIDADPGAIRSPFNVRGVQLTRHANLVVVSGRPAEVLLFDSKGTFLRVIGRVGAGPGEYRSVAGIGLTGGDTLAVVDLGFSSSRIAIFDINGRHIKTISTGVFVKCCASSGGFLIRGQLARSQSAQTTPDIVGPWHIASWSSPTVGEPPTASEIARLPQLRLSEGWPLVMLSSETQRGGFYSFSTPLRIPFYAKAEIVFAGPYIVNTAGTGSSYALYDWRGRPVRTVETGLPRHPVTPDDIARLRRAISDSIADPGTRNRILNAVQRMEKPATHPAIRGVVGQRDGSVWVLAHDLAGRGPNVWTRFDSTGQRTGELELQNNTHLLEVRDSLAVVMQETSGTGLQRIAVHALRRQR